MAAWAERAAARLDSASRVRRKGVAGFYAREGVGERERALGGGERRGGEQKESENR